MSTARIRWIPVIWLVLGCHAPGAFAQSASGAAERLHANAVASFRQARFSEAHGRFIGLADIGRSPLARQLAFARERGWRNLKFYATVGDDFASDYRGLAPDGSEWPALDVWTKLDGQVRHFWASELGGTEDAGQDARGAPDPTPLWNMLDLTPAGRGSDWYPKLDYRNAG